MLAASSPFPGRLGCSRYRSGIREFWQARTSEAGGLTLTSRHAHKSRIRPPSVGSSGPTFRNPRAIDGARARKSPESLDFCNESRKTTVPSREAVLRLTSLAWAAPAPPRGLGAGRRRRWVNYLGRRTHLSNCVGTGRRRDRCLNTTNPHASADEDSFPGVFMCQRGQTNFSNLWRLSTKVLRRWGRQSPSQPCCGGRQWG